ncbi:hypothetical protein [Actinopolymorpha pittospori]|uniref:Uncharacterized protein n=1 Tax=Actinopolymorpha pittospori TaxID=648752 RepID=A0A927MWH0_9ACTN|nr:hypothetical protein [Actinopolymorpha pittospori]MBE1607884.1 hypothetical protein [Actinopolymorpha pittospori]
MDGARRRRVTRRAIGVLSAGAVFVAGGALGALLLRPWRGPMTSAEWYSRTPEDRVIDVGVRTGPEQPVQAYDVEEDAGRVKVTVWMKPYQGAQDATGRATTVTVRLTDPLGERQVVDQAGIPLAAERRW